MLGGAIVGSFFTFGIIKLVLSLFGFKKPKYLFGIFIFFIFCTPFTLVGLYDDFHCNKISTFELISFLLKLLVQLISFFVWVLFDEKQYQDEVSFKIFILSRRALAGLIDHLFLIILLMLIKNLGGDLGLWGSLCLVLTYFSFLEIYGNTLGKLCMQLNVRVFRNSNLLLWSLLRNVLKYILPLISCVIFPQYIVLALIFASVINLLSLLMFGGTPRTWYDLNIEIQKKIIGAKKEKIV
jgi:hypothetical protein